VPLKPISGHPDTPEDRAGAAGWAALFGGGASASVDRPDLVAWADRMADLLSPALADHLLAPLPAPDAPLVDPERAAKARLYNRFLRQAQIGALRLIRETGARFVCLKGFALAHQVYDQPEPRIVGDVDLLVLPDDLPKVAARLSAAGYAALPIASRFGFISESSFLPILSADGQVAVDLHIAPDAWPASRALGCDAVFRRAMPFKVEEMELLGPAAEHAFFLIVTNIAKDRFGPEGVRKLVDAAMLLRSARDFDWEAVASLAETGGYSGALSAFLRLMERLGAKPGGPARLRRPLGFLAAGELERVAVRYRRAQVPRLSLAGKLRRELLLGPDPLSVLQINYKRLKGLASPGSGLPPGMAERR
jgi:hypothetical protein